MDTEIGLPNHVGLVTNCVGNKVYTVEGNTGNGKTWKTRIVSEKKWDINSASILGYISCGQ